MKKIYAFNDVADDNLNLSSDYDVEKSLSMFCSILATEYEAFFKSHCPDAEILVRINEMTGCGGATDGPDVELRTFNTASEYSENIYNMESAAMFLSKIEDKLLVENREEWAVKK